MTRYFIVLLHGIPTFISVITSLQLLRHSPYYYQHSPASPPTSHDTNTSIPSLTRQENPQWLDKPSTSTHSAPSPLLSPPFFEEFPRIHFHHSISQGGANRSWVVPLPKPRIASTDYVGTRPCAREPCCGGLLIRRLRLGPYVRRKRHLTLRIAFQVRDVRVS